MRKIVLGLSLCAAALGCNSPTRVARKPVAPTVEIDARQTLSTLASDEFEGRGIGTAGLDRAADLIAGDFRRIGLRTLAGNEEYYQPFEMTTATEISPTTFLKIGDRNFTLKDDFSPTSFSGEGHFSGAVVFAGYGIKADEQKYNDYEGLDAKGKVMLALRYDPHDEKGNSRFEKDGWSEHAALVAKAKTAKDAGAVAILLVTPAEFADDPNLLVRGARISEENKIPIIRVRKTLAEELLKRGGAGDLKSVQQKIDSTGKPASFELADVKVEGEVELVQTKVAVKNVVGLLPGQIRDEYVVVGAHYDHLGRGGIGSLTRNRSEIHNGADDNASGTTAVLELAATLARRGTPTRSIIFAAFTGEEEGLIGSKRFVEHPPVAISKINAMINLDMVGRIRSTPSGMNRATTASSAPTQATTGATTRGPGILYVGGSGTAAAFEEIVAKADERSPLVVKDIGKGGLGPSDHMSFALKRVPVMFLFSGLHGDYHRPTDDVEKINFEGLSEVVDFAADLIEQVAALPRQEYVVAADAHSMTMGRSSGGRGVTLGVIPDYSAGEGSGGGVKISGTTPGTPAAKAGLKEGDVIVRWNEKTVDSLQDLSDLLANAKVGEVVKLKLMRDGKEVETEATLAKRE